MSKMQRCDQGHFYDAAVHRRCPSCGIPGLDVNPTRPPTVPIDPYAAKPQGPPPPMPQMQQPTPASPSRPVTPAIDPSLTRARTDANDGRTVAWWSKDENGTNPVVGWLVAIDGPEKGRDFRIYSEGNSVGRDASNKIVINDQAVSRYKHTFIFYDPASEDAAFFLQAGDEKGTRLTRRGQFARKLVLEPTRLQAFDVIEIGKSQLVFVPLCNEQFQWDVSRDEQQGAAK